jgi:pyruvate formate lyase activating enzyme
MIIKGLQPTTLIDYPGQVACIVFTAGCTFNCGFCYNKSLVENSANLPEISEQNFFDFLDTRKKFLDGVVITGGEPTIYKDLPDFIKKIKQKGFLVKLDTNGTNPEMLQYLINNKLVDYFAMDIKNSPEKYDATTNKKIDINKIEKSIDLIMDSGIKYEFRTTAMPRLIKKEDFLKIGVWLKGAKKYCLQQFKSMGELIDESFRTEKTYSEAELNQFKELLKPYFDEIEVRV